MYLERVYCIYLSLGVKEKIVVLISLSIYDNYQNYNAFFLSKFKGINEKIYKDFEKECEKASDKIAQRTTAIKINEARLYLNMIHIVALKHIKQSYVLLIICFYATIYKQTKHYTKTYC